MLETKNLKKVYKPKKGVPVVALNNISIKFPQKGMVFLLGKSGSGKSTLLNLLGGLDRYDEGEIIIKGKSSKNFKQQDFDSYRNTCVGFIFQEYNILDEFSVGANIALAIELQGKKATDEEINQILREVDLEGYGNRKPNELSGGQKQRVAIARALIKKPEIIMADEPTGALDSNTGRQIFDTLKKLSKDKLIIVVSHDREFSEQYADRIIELADGNIISDVELDESAEIAPESGNLEFKGKNIEIAEGYHLTKEDMDAINQYIDMMADGKVNLSLGAQKSSGSRFKKTDESSIVSNINSTFTMIKSKLPFKNALKIGAGGLKYKKFKLVMTILLSCIAFGLFGLSDTFGSYDHVKTCTRSLVDSDVKKLSFIKSEKVTGEGYSYWNPSGNKISSEDIEKLEADIGIKLEGAYKPYGMDLSFITNLNFENENVETGLYNTYLTSFSAYVDVNEKILEDNGCKVVAGKLPDGKKDEIAISTLMARTIKLYGYRNSDGTITEITDYDELLGKTLSITEKTFTITGIVDTGLDIDRYSTLTERKNYYSSSDRIINYALYNEFQYEAEGSLAGCMMTGEGYVNTYLENSPKIYNVNDISLNTNDSYGICFDGMGTFDGLIDTEIEWFGDEKTTLADNEILMGEDLYNEFKEMGTDFAQGELSFRNFFTDEVIKTGYKLVGLVKSEKFTSINSILVGSDNLCKEFCKDKMGTYDFVIGAMPENKSDVEKIVKYCYANTGDYRYEIQNNVTFELETVNEVLKVFSKVFFWIGFGFACFASIMLANFIGTSIAYKKQEIGILRGIGARSSDVFKIFLSEGYIIAFINFVLSAIGVGVVTNLINYFLRKHYGILVSVLGFGIRQIALLFALSIAVTTIACFIPVMKIASKKPVDAIRNR